MRTVDREVERPASVHVVEGRDPRVEEKEVDLRKRLAVHLACVVRLERSNRLRGQESVIDDVVGAACDHVRQRARGLAIQPPHDSIDEAVRLRRRRPRAEALVADQL